VPYWLVIYSTARAKHIPVTDVVAACEGCIYIISSGPDWFVFAMLLNKKNGSQLCSVAMEKLERSESGVIKDNKEGECVGQHLPLRLSTPR